MEGQVWPTVSDDGSHCVALGLRSAELEPQGLGWRDSEAEWPGVELASAGLEPSDLERRRTGTSLLGRAGAIAVPVLLGLLGIVAVRWGFASAEVDQGAAAARVSAGFPPAVTVAGSAVTVSWSEGLDDDGAVGGYEVMRYDASGMAYHAGSGCAGVVDGFTCVEGALPAGDWQYAVRTWRADGRAGLESARSLAVTVGANGRPLLGWASSAYGHSRGAAQ